MAEAQHAEPIWRERADFIIAADISSYSEVAEYEQLWARQIDELSFEVCCIPFFAYDLALGDHVETDSGDRRYVIARVIQPSGRYVFRAWFGDSHHPQEEIVAELLAMGALVERSSAHLFAVDAHDAQLAKQVALNLQAHEDAGRLVYETGQSA
ncbi:MAG: DUF4265 domain-containing protein [Acidimicrobiia bacterium]